MGADESAPPLKTDAAKNRLAGGETGKDISAGPLPAVASPHDGHAERTHQGGRCPLGCCWRRVPCFNGRSPNSRAADPQTTAITAGTSITYYGDVHVGTIAERVGNPHDTDPREWSCGFYPGSHQSDTTATFEEARADFEHAWQVFLSNRTEADFQAWHDQRDWTERKYADAGKRLEPSSHGPGKPCSHFMKCPCGAVFDLHGVDACAPQHERVPTRANVN